MIYIRTTFLGAGVFLTVSLELLIKYTDQTYITENKTKVFAGLQTGGSRREEGHKDSSKEEEFKPPKLLHQFCSVSLVDLCQITDLL